MSSKSRSVARQGMTSQKPTLKEVDLRMVRAKNSEFCSELAEYLAKFDMQSAKITDDTRELSVAEFTQFLRELGDTVSKLELIRACMGKAAEWTAECLDKSDIEVNTVSRSYDQGYEECAGEFDDESDFEEDESCDD